MEADERDGRRCWRRAIAVIDNQIDPTTGTIRLKAPFANKDRRLWPGAFVNVRVVTEIKHDATVVPSQAVQRGPTIFSSMW